MFLILPAVVTVMEENESFARTVAFLRRGDSFGVRASKINSGSVRFHFHSMTCFQKTTTVNNLYYVKCLSSLFLNVKICFIQQQIRGNEKKKEKRNVLL